MLRSLLVAFALVITAVAPAAADVLKVGDRLAELDIAVDAKGKPVKLKAFRNKWVLVTVGAAWCKPCAKELPTWDKLAAELAGKVSFVAIGIDDEIETGKKFHQKLKLKNMSLAYMPASKSGVVASYGSDTMPTTVVADPKGIVRMVRRGFEEGDASGELKKMRAELAKLVK
ncbi:MAG TPA: TlpA disulfide reductase family protein [Kofleriaceae bacterium]|jgi:thiol-disulfide isomerase/thioredoxin|nr:TlpA disulfide reductase family protein [Kofleriaceae bacterium]